MSNLERLLWNYIDGLCSAEEELEVKKTLKSDLAFKALYDELLSLNAAISEMDIEEPSMSFTRNVMDKIAVEPAPVALKTQVDKRIVLAIAAVFVFSLVGILIYAISSSKTSADVNLPTINFEQTFNYVFNGTTLKLFLFIDLILLLVYLDFYVRRKFLNAQKKGE